MSEEPEPLLALDTLGQRVEPHIGVVLYRGLSILIIELPSGDQVFPAEEGGTHVFMEDITSTGVCMGCSLSDLHVVREFC